MLLYLKINVRDEVDFLLADEGKSFLQVHTIIFDGHAQSSQNIKFVISLEYLKKAVKTSIHATDWFTYTHFKQVWSGMSAHAQCAYRDA